MQDDFNKETLLHPYKLTESKFLLDKEHQSNDVSDSQDEAVKLENIQESGPYSSKRNKEDKNFTPKSIDISPMLELSKKSSENNESTKFEWNNFLVRRACFRGVSVFYKSRFSKINTSWQRKRVNKKKKTHMHVLIKNFAIQEFGRNLIMRLSNDEWVQLRTTLYSILFSHRYKKNDDFLEGVNFELVRNVLYKYTTETRVELMSNPFFSLIILHFLNNGKTQFINSKVKGRPELYANEIKTELESLYEEANHYLKECNFYEK